MSQSLTKIQTLRTALGRLNAERRAGVSPNQTRYERRASEFHKRLSLEVDTRRGKARVLVTGQIGVGKSSELWQFYHDQKNSGTASFMVFCDLEKEEHPERCGATAVFLTIFRDCWYETKRFRSGQRELLVLRDEILTRLIDWLNGERLEIDQKVLFRFGGMDFPVFLSEPNKALSLILGKAAQHYAVSRQSDHLGLVPDSLINLLNKLLDWVTSQIRGERPILLVDHVDKIRDSSAAEDVLVKSVPQWNRIRASIIMTAPFEHTLGELRNSVESKWGRPLMLYPVKIPDSPSGNVDPIYSKIVANAGLSSLISQESLSYLAYYSGGILRNFVRYLIDSCKESHLNGHDRIELVDSQRVVDSAKIAYSDYGTAELELLDEITVKETGLGRAATLLRSPIGLIIGENKPGESGIIVHPLAETALEKYRLKAKKGSQDVVD